MKPTLDAEVQITGPVAVGIDVGGTHVRFALVSDGRVIGDVCRGTTGKRQSPRDFLELMVQAIGASHGESHFPQRERQLAGKLVGLALPGLVDDKHGSVIRSVSLPFLERFPISAELARLTGCRIHLSTDAAAATWGEYQALSSPSSTFAHLRLGTGVALGIVRDGMLVDLDTGRTQHLEVLVVAEGADALECRCGLRGCLETLASGRALAEQWSECGGPDGFDELRAAWLRGESTAQGLVDRARQGIRLALRNIVERFGVTFCSLGGGVVDRFPELVAPLIAEWRGPGVFTVEHSALGDHAGVIGAARLAQDRGNN